MLYLFFSALFFSFTIFTHLFWCRFKKGEELHITSFVVISLIFLLGYFATARFLIAGQDDLTGIWVLPLEMTAAVFYIFCIPFFLVFYYSTTIDSPSRRTIALLREKGTLTYEELSREITDDKFIMTRLNPLVEFGYAQFDGKYFRLSPRAIFSCRVIKVYQKLLGRPLGG